MRWVLLACWVFILAYATLFGERSAPFGQLESALIAGQVNSVEVTPGLGSKDTGYTTQDLRWRQGLFRYHSEVEMVTPGTGEPPSQDGITVRRGRDITSDLTRYNSQVDIVRVPLQQSSGEIYGWQVPTWFFFFGLIVIMGTLSLLITGPQPWRATRWAWFWLMTNPVGTILFLILAGQTPPLRQPRDLGRRLTGLWAFLLSLVLAWFLPHWWPSP